MAAAVGMPAPLGAAWMPKDWTATEKANVKVVEQFERAWEQKNVDALVALFAPDALIRASAHTPQPPSNPAALRAMATKFLSAGSVKFTTLETVAVGPMVINNRIDRLTMPDGGVQDIYFMGVFFLKDGKIKEWLDYEVAPGKTVKAGQTK